MYFLNCFNLLGIRKDKKKRRNIFRWKRRRQIASGMNVNFIRCDWNLKNCFPFCNFLFFYFCCKNFIYSSELYVLYPITNYPRLAFLSFFSLENEEKQLAYSKEAEEKFDAILEGNLTDVPPLPRSTVRIFLSSTFSGKQSDYIISLSELYCQKS